MKVSTNFILHPSALQKRLMAMPLLFKIMGIGFMTAVLFGAVAFYEIRVGVYRTHYRVHGETALYISQAMAARLAPFLRAQDIPSVNDDLNQTMLEFPDVRYIVVQDRAGRILAHGFTFPKEAPPDLVGRGGDLCASCHASISPEAIPADLIEVPSRLMLEPGQIRAYTRHRGLILDVNVPIENTDGASLRLGVGDTVIAREIAKMTQSLLWSLGLCVLMGLSLSILLAYWMVRPIRNLVETTLRVGEGDFHARATVFWNDEIGGLAVSFNQMAERIESYKCEVQEKEAARVALIGKIVQAQEEERKRVARELHDQLGQSLSTTLLTIESHCGNCTARTEHCNGLRQNIRGLIDEVRQMAWDVRPSILDDYGLDLALARYAEEMSKRLPYPIEYECVAPAKMMRLPAEIEVTLYRITQEAVTNIIRHAEATHACVVLICRGKEVSLIIEDNGRGVDPAADAGKSLGVMGMKERAALVGGSFMIESQLGKGTTVRVIIPLSGDHHDDKDPDSG